MKQSVYDLTYHLIDTRNPKEHLVAKCERAYFFWKESWFDTYKALGIANEKIFSDDFLDRELSALFLDETPVALFFNNWLDISRDSILAHSYFKNHPKEVLSFLREQKIGQVMFLTYMTVHPEWRSHLIDVSMPDLLFSLSITRFHETNSKLLSGYIRTDKSFHSSFYRHGAQKILSSTAYNVPVDFCYVTHTSATLSEEPGVKDACEYLWNNMKTNTQPKRIAS